MNLFAKKSWNSYFHTDIGFFLTDWIQVRAPNPFVFLAGFLEITFAGASILFGESIK